MKLLLSWALCAGVVFSATVRPPRLPAFQASPAIDQLLRGQVHYILQEGFSDTIPSETEEPIRSRTGAVFAAATCLKFANCDSPQQTREFVIKLLRSLTRAHVAGGGATASGKPWGDHWQSALWAYQAAFGSWLLWSELPEDVRAGIVKMVVHEADRFIDLPPPYAEFIDTKAEENSWNSLIQIFAAEIMPDHPHATRWRERGLEYTISSVATRSDRKSKNRMVGGRPLGSWLHGANIHDDFTMENHGIVHPDYMTTISQNLTHALVYRLLGKAVPNAVVYNAQPSYDILKVFTNRDGSLYYPNGTDWNLHHLDHAWNVDVLAERVLRDRDAGALANCALGTLQKMQARNPSGRLFVPGEYATYSTAEQHSAFLVASGLIAAKLWPAVPDSRSLDAVWDKLTGVRVYDDGHLFISRTRDSITSFAWGLRIMGQTIPFSFDPILYPLNHSYVGIVGELPEEDKKPSRLGIAGAAIDRAVGVDSLRPTTIILSEEAGGVSVTATARHGNLRHQFSFTALPNGVSVYMERFDGQTEKVYGGLVSLLQDPRWVYGTGSRKIERGDGWLDVDNRLGFVTIGASPPVERQDHLTHTLFLNPLPRRGIVSMIVTLPNATTAQTKAAAAKIRYLETGSDSITAAAITDFLVVTNFEGAGHTNPLTAKILMESRVLSVPVNGGATRILYLRK